MVKGRDIQQVHKMFGLKRSDLLDTLKSALPEGIIRYTITTLVIFSTMVDGVAIGAVFNNGKVARGDIYLRRRWSTI